MKKVTQINLRDEFFVVHEDHVDQRLSDDRTWFEVRGVKVKSLGNLNLSIYLFLQMNRMRGPDRRVLIQENGALYRVNLSLWLSL